MHGTLENHWLACMAILGGGGRVTRTLGATVVANPQYAGKFLNFMALRDVHPDHLDPTLEMGEALLAGYGRPPVVYLSPIAGNMEALSRSLAGRGWCLLARQVVLVRDLSLTLASGTPAMAVQEVADARSLRHWTETLQQAGEAEPQAAQAWSTLLQTPGDGARARLYLAFLEGQPVGTGLTWTQGDMAAMYCGAVLPAYRRRGVERATLTRRLQDVIRDGARTALIQTEAGSPVEHLCLTHLGFTLSHRREIWAPLRA